MRDRSILILKGYRLVSTGFEAHVGNKNPLTAGTHYIRVLHGLLPHYLSAFKHVEDKTRHKSARFENS